jgi:hypothetical protein
MACGEATPYTYLGREEETGGVKEAWSRGEKNRGGRWGARSTGDRSRSVKAQGLPDQQREQVVDALGEVD